MDEFDDEFSKCFLKADMVIKRMYACLDFKTLFDGCLGFGNYAPGKKTSSVALEQGGRDKEYHSLHFFLGDDGTPLLKGRYDELQSTWLPIQGKGIEVFSKLGSLRVKALLAAGSTAILKMPYDSLQSWSSAETIKKNMQLASFLTPTQKAKWSEWFASVPETADAVPSHQKFA